MNICGKEFYFFGEKSNSDQVNSIADYLPDDQTFLAKNIAETNFRKMLEVFAIRLSKYHDSINNFSEQMSPECATELLTEWEKMLGIPDECYKIENVNIEERQRNATIKLGKMNVQTIEEFKSLADSFGIVATVQSGIDYVLGGGAPFAGGDQEARFTIVITFINEESATFPLTFPFQFGDEILGLLQCVFEKVKPANTNVLFFEELPFVPSMDITAQSIPSTLNFEEHTIELVSNDIQAISINSSLLFGSSQIDISQELVQAIGDLDFDMDVDLNFRYEIGGADRFRITTVIDLDIGDTVQFTYENYRAAINNRYFANSSAGQANQSSLQTDGSEQFLLVGYTGTINGFTINNGDGVPDSLSSQWGFDASRLNVIVLTATAPTDIEFIGSDGGTSGNQFPFTDVIINAQGQQYNWDLKNLAAGNTQPEASGFQDIFIESYNSGQFTNWQYIFNGGVTDYTKHRLRSQDTTTSSLTPQQTSMRSDGGGSAIAYSNSEYHVITPNYYPSYANGMTIEAMVTPTQLAAGACGVIQSGNFRSLGLWLMRFDNFDGGSVVPTFTIMQRNESYENASEYINIEAEVRSTVPVVLGDVYHLLATIRFSDNTLEFWINGISQGTSSFDPSWFTGNGFPNNSLTVGNDTGTTTAVFVGPCFANGFVQNQRMILQDIKIHLLEADQSFATQQSSFCNYTIFGEQTELEAISVPVQLGIYDAGSNIVLADQQSFIAFEISDIATFLEVVEINTGSGVVLSVWEKVSGVDVQLGANSPILFAPDSASFGINNPLATNIYIVIFNTQNVPQNIEILTPD